MKFFLSLFFVFMITESCSSAKESVTSKEINQESLLGTYSIKQIGPNTSLPNDLSITFETASNRVSGFAGCNTFFGNYALEKNTITFQNIATSKKFCQEKINTIERHLLSALDQINTLQIKNNKLVFSNSTSDLLIAEEKDVAAKQKNVEDYYYTSSVTYKAISRNTFEYVEITGPKVTISTDRDLKEFNNYSCSETDWNSIEKMIQRINLSKIDRLKAPTEKRLYDGAAHATLTIRTGDVIATSSSFDHGYPPQEIEALVNKVLSIKESVIKH
ncbi:MAG: META domain-containing protein [Winogradskyella sp.]|uniref:META domain-containing protein n=1 Tax=Winogradskyella sp. TaxID=1883156 RepID=UPI0017FAA1D4|nr:META domain-containing protein [Winogradskyella sp.]